MGMLVCGVDGRWSMVGWSDGFVFLFGVFSLLGETVKRETHERI